MLFGILNLSFWGYVAATLILTHITIVSVTLYLHRYSAHRAIELASPVKHFFRFWLWLTTGMITKEWTAIHRKHHAKCEVEGDPHSPMLEGISTVLWQGAELYRREAACQDTLDKYGKGTPDDWIERNLYSKHSSLGMLTMFVLDIVLFGLPGISIMAIQMMWIPFFAAGVINGIGHYFGYRNYEVNDASRNIVPIGILIGGEELHNNHHAFGSSAKFSNKWWEFDVGWFYIRLLQLFRLAKVKYLPPQLREVPGKNTIDLETVKAFLSNRLEILSEYTHDVMLPTFKEEKSKAGSDHLFNRAKRLFIRSDYLLDEQAKDKIARILEGRTSLQMVYQFRERLTQIWNSTAASNKDILEALQDWCKQAEATGIDVLCNFAGALRRYG